MKATGLEINGRRPRVLLAIASHGDKNLGFLRQIIETYRAMPLDLDVVVHSNIPKDLGAGVKVVVGLPAKNPWSLPFAHKRLFADNVERYDLFIYSEDDIGVTEANLRAFLRATPRLDAREIAGFLRFEVDGSGNRSMPDLHGYFHWKPGSVRDRGDYQVAEHTNEHAGYYLLTQAQLRKIVASGGYVRNACSGRYGMPETASSDPYTRCGFKRVVCISALDDFLIHHMPNKYVGIAGIPLAELRRQTDILRDIAAGKHPATVLCEVESALLQCHWSKCLDEKPVKEVFELVPETAKTVLTIGSGNGALEGRLLERGAKVTSFPLDSVVGAATARLGVEMIYGAMGECFANLKGRTFDAVVMTNLVHLLPDPKAVFDACARCVVPGGALVLSGPNFGRVHSLARRALRKGAFREIRTQGKSVINPWRLGAFERCVRKAGFRVAAIRWPNESSAGRGGFGGSLVGFTAKEWVLQAVR